MWNKFLRAWALHEKQVTLVILAVVLALPLLVKQKYILSIAIMCGVYVVLSLSMNLITGYLGIVVLGQAAFFGIGAYAAAILATTFHTDFLINLTAAATICAAAGLLIGMPVLRLKGNYLSIVTLGFCEITRIIELNWVSVTKGPFGIRGIPAPSILGFGIKGVVKSYYLIVVLCLFSCFIISRIMNSRVGRCISAIKGDELAAQAMGINIFKYKMMCFALSAAIAGLAGAFYAQYISFIDSTTFTSDQSFQILGMTILGGLGNIWGSVLGAISMTVLPELLRGVAEYRQIIYGLILAFMVIVRPTGILGGFQLSHIRLQCETEKEAETKCQS